MILCTKVAYGQVVCYYSGPRSFWQGQGHWKKKDFYLSHNFITELLVAHTWHKVIKGLNFLVHNCDQMLDTKAAFGQVVCHDPGPK